MLPSQRVAHTVRQRIQSLVQKGSLGQKSLGAEERRLGLTQAQE